MMDRSRSKTDLFRDLSRKITDLYDRISAIENRVLSTDWILIGAAGAPAFQNSWVNYSTGSDGNDVAQFAKDSSGIVRLKGVVKSGSSNVAMFTLPVGFRPAPTVTGAMSYCLFPTSAGGAFGQVYVTSTGDVVLNLGSNAYVYLDSIQFRAA